MLPARLLCVLGLLALAAGCGDKPAGPSGPPPPSVTNLAIAGADAVLTGLSSNYTLTATLSDGIRRTIPAAWSSSNPDVGSVDGSVDGAGRLDGRAHGSTRLTATFDGLTASKTVQVINNYEGRWEGRFLIRACTETGDLVGWCIGTARVGTVHTLDLIVHHRVDLNQVRGTRSHLKGELTGTVGADGRLTLSGLLEWWGYDYPQELTESFLVGPWDTNLDGAGGMTGRFSWLYTVHLYSPGTVHMENEFVTFTRVSASLPRALLK